MIPTNKLNFKDFRKEFSRLTDVVDNNVSLNNLYWYETNDSFLLYFNDLYTEVSKVAIENSNEFDSVNDFKVKFLTNRVELVKPILGLDDFYEVLRSGFVMKPQVINNVLEVVDNA